MVRGDEVSAAEGPAVVTVRLTLLPGVAEVEAREQFTPWVVGAVQLSVTALVKPPCAPIARLKPAVPPAETFALEGDGVTVKSGGTLKVAPTVRPLVMAKVHAAVPEQGPVQPPKLEPLAAAAERVTEVFEGNEDEHWVGQLMPAGVLVTVPVPATVTVRVGLVHDGRLKEEIRVDHWLPVVGTYSLVYQKVQSSVGSIAMLL